jgi:hypothetical protein
MLAESLHKVTFTAQAKERWPLPSPANWTGRELKHGFPLLATREVDARLESHSYCKTFGLHMSL